MLFVRIEAEGRKIVYSGDLASEKDLTDIITDCDLLITEASHVDLAALSRMVADYEVGELVVTHIDVGRGLEKIRRTLKKSGLHRVNFAGEGLEFVLKKRCFGNGSAQLFGDDFTLQVLIPKGR